MPAPFANGSLAFRARSRASIRIPNLSLPLYPGFDKLDPLIVVFLSKIIPPPKMPVRGPAV